MVGAHQGLLLLLRELLVLDGIKRNWVVLFQIDGELLKVPFLHLLPSSVMCLESRTDIETFDA